MKIALIGLGLIGKERLQAILKLKEDGYSCDLVAIYDANLALTKTLATQHNLPAVESIEHILNKKPDWVIVCVPHDIAVPITEFFLARNIHVLIEKPLGRTVKEARSMLAKQVSPQQLRVGFNYRFYEGIQHAYRDMQSGFFGKIISVNIQFGHGGRPGDEKTWKLDPIQSGGGCLLDPGIHLLDLVNCFSSTPVKFLAGTHWQGFWNTGIEEESHLILKNNNTTFNINVSVLRWKSLFRIEIHGTDGYGVVSGRNRSYGPQTYVRGKRWGWMNGKTQTESEELVITTDGDDTFYHELKQILFPENTLPLHPCTGEEALAAMMLWERCARDIHVRTETEQVIA